MDQLSTPPKRKYGEDMQMQTTAQPDMDKRRKTEDRLAAAEQLYLKDCCSSGHSQFGAKSLPKIIHYLQQVDAVKDGIG